MAIEKRKRADGTIAYRVRVEGRAGSGDRDQGGGRTFDSLKEAKAYDADLKQSRRRGISFNPSRQRYGDHLGEWLDRKALTTERTTWADYEFLCRRHVAPALGNVPLASLTHKQLQTFLNAKARTGRLDGTGGLSRDRVMTLRTVLHDSLAVAVRWSLLHGNPADGLGVPKKGKPKPKASWTGEQVAYFLEGTADDPYAALWMLAFTCAMRRGELLGLHWRDVDLERGFLTVCDTWVQVGSKGEPGGPKSAKSGRRVSVGDRTLAALREHYGRQCEYKSGTRLVWEEHDLVFPNDYGRQLHPTSLTHMFRRLADRLALPRIRLHDSRGTSATLTLAGGAGLRTVSDRLGHVRTSTTADLYPRTQDGADRRAAQGVEGEIFGPPSQNPPRQGRTEDD